MFSGGGGGNSNMSFLQQQQNIDELSKEIRTLNKTIDSLQSTIEQQRHQLSAHGEQLVYLSEHVGGSAMQQFGANNYYRPSSYSYAAAGIFSGESGESPIWFIAGWLVFPLLVLLRGLWTMASPLVYTYRWLTIFDFLAGNVTISELSSSSQNENFAKNANNINLRSPTSAAIAAARRRFRKATHGIAFLNRSSNNTSQEDLTSLENNANTNNTDNSSGMFLHSYSDSFDDLEQFYNEDDEYYFDQIMNYVSTTSSNSKDNSNFIPSSSSPGNQNYQGARLDHELQSPYSDSEGSGDLFSPEQNRMGLRNNSNSTNKPTTAFPMNRSENFNQQQQQSNRNRSTTGKQQQQQHPHHHHHRGGRGGGNDFASQSQDPMHDLGMDLLRELGDEF